MKNLNFFEISEMKFEIFKMENTLDEVMVIRTLTDYKRTNQ